uniref:Uncharacterized protein n=1 Tax=Anguilla anguilla TaxID=7936 RepID=A0A0E9PK13_ANGAN
MNHEYNVELVGACPANGDHRTPFNLQ